MARTDTPCNRRADHLPALLLLLCSSAVILFAGCTGMNVVDFESGRPLLDPTQYFTGETSSSGVLENRDGAPKEPVTTQTVGRWVDGTLLLEQELQIGGKKQHRSWRIRKLDANHFEATANDMVGTARGEARGNVFHWSFTLALSPGNPLSRVQMSQWMHLQPDGKALLNHSTIRKFGIVVAQVTEVFQRKEKPSWGPGR